MAISTLQKLIKNSLPPPARILASLRNPHLHSPEPTQPLPFEHRLDRELWESSEINAGSFLGSSQAENLTRLGPLMFYQISPVGSFLPPVLSTGFVEDRADDDRSGLWADSVKKKRKKKMNKHKYKKLRKRLRRQT